MMGYHKGMEGSDPSWINIVSSNIELKCTTKSKWNSFVDRKVVFYGKWFRPKYHWVEMSNTISIYFKVGYMCVCVSMRQ